MRLRSKLLAAMAALLVACPLCLAADAPVKSSLRPSKAPGAEPAPKDFWNGYLAPTMAKDLADDRAAFVLAQSGPLANPWMQGPSAAARVGEDALGALKGALKGYLAERFDVASWSLPLIGRRGEGSTAVAAPRGGPRVRFGVAHMAPKAEIVVPLGQGRFAFSADVRGRIGTSFETGASHLRVGATLDPLARDAGVGLTARF